MTTEIIYELTAPNHQYSQNLRAIITGSSRLYFRYLEDAQKFCQENQKILSSEDEDFSENVIKKLA